MKTAGPQSAVSCSDISRREFLATSGAATLVIDERAKEVRAIKVS